MKTPMTAQPASIEVDYDHRQRLWRVCWRDRAGEQHLAYFESQKKAFKGAARLCPK